VAFGIVDGKEKDIIEARNKGIATTGERECFLLIEKRRESRGKSGTTDTYGIN
jgi:hypothetical protein